MFAYAVATDGTDMRVFRQPARNLAGRTAIYRISDLQIPLGITFIRMSI